jgi:hypothetical protein
LIARPILRAVVATLLGDAAEGLVRGRSRCAWLARRGCITRGALVRLALLLLLSSYALLGTSHFGAARETMSWCCRLVSKLLSDYKRLLTEAYWFCGVVETALVIGGRGG